MISSRVQKQDSHNYTILSAEGTSDMNRLKDRGMEKQAGFAGYRIH